MSVTYQFGVPKCSASYVLPLNHTHRDAGSVSAYASNRNPKQFGPRKVRNPFNKNRKRCVVPTFTLCTGPLLRVSKIALRGTEDFSSPELLTGIKLYEDCEYLDELDGEVRDVVAADAWSIGAIIFNAATGVKSGVSLRVCLLYKHKCDTGCVSDAHVCLVVPQYTHL